MSKLFNVRVPVNVFVIGACLMTGVSPAEASDLFRTTPRFAVGNGPSAIASCDLNEDGLPDVVTANQSFDDVAVLLSDGAGGFLPQYRFGVGGSPRDLVCVDLNGDDNLDVVTADFGDDTFSILRGNGDGTFAVGATTVTTQNEPVSIAVGYFDDDSFPDIAVGSASSIRIYLGDGAFGFTYLDYYDNDADALVVVDLDGDAIGDLMGVDTGASLVTVLWGNGDGSFTSIGTGFTVGVQPTSAASEDVNEDHVLDILVSNKGTHDVSLLYGLGVRQFAEAVSLDVGSEPAQVLARDVDVDGHVDVITVNAASNDVTVRAGYGDGTFDPEIRFGAGDNPKGLAIADFDDDQLLDIATANFVSNDVSLLLGNGDATFRWEPRFGVGINPRSAAACDLNNDGVIDLVAADRDTDEVSVLMGLGDGSYLPEVRYDTPEGPTAIRCADLKEDGNMDVVVACYESSEVGILFGNGDGTFLAKPRFSVGPRPMDIAACDINEDGHLDVVTANGTNVSVLHGQGNGFFLPEIRLSYSAAQIECVDMDADGHVDLVTGYSLTSYNHRVAVRRGNGDGSFGDPYPMDPQTFGPISGLAVTMIDGDSNLDVVVTGLGSGPTYQWRVLRGNGDGTLTRLGAFDTGASPRSIVATDIDLNGTTDVIVANYADDDVSVFLGNGDGTFADQARFGVGEAPYMVITSDVDNDGDDDLIVANSESDSLSVLFNTAIEGPIAPDDYDGDGVVDGEDNCPETPNSDQADFDGDTLGDACDLDIDDDGVSNNNDVCDFTPFGMVIEPNGTSPSDLDGDCDVDLSDYAVWQNSFSGPGV